MKIANIEKVTKSLLSPLPKRSIDVLSKRFGIFNLPKRTLDSIGKSYNITRERIRQIELCALQNIRANLLLKNEMCLNILEDLKTELEKRGQFTSEKDFLNLVPENDKNYVRFFLVLGNGFNFHKENDDFLCAWSVADSRKIKWIQAGLASLTKNLSVNEVFTKDDIVEKLKKYLLQNSNPIPNPEEIKFDKSHFHSWLGISKKISSNSLGEWGLLSSPSIKPRGIKDYTYLVMRKHGSPMHFKEVTEAIKTNFQKPAHTQTVHNELIKDNRFVLVGRGLYALKEWGYMAGVVKDVMFNILQKTGPLSRSELIKRVLKERHVQESTISINLQNKKFFKKLDSETYHIV